MIKSFNILNNKTLCIEIASNIQVYQVKHENCIPETIKLGKVSKLSSAKLYKNTIEINLRRKKEQDANEYSIIIIYKKINVLDRLIKIFRLKNENLYFTEIIRQPPLFVKKECLEDKPQGYCIFGRSNGDSRIHISYKKQQSRRKTEKIPGMLKQKLEIINSSHLAGKVPNILILSAKICCVLQKMKRQVGINNISYQKYVDLPFANKIAPNFVVPGSFSCQWLRDLFLDTISFFEGIEIRALDAFAQSRCYEPLVRCSHAVAEVFCRETKKWFLIDPWNNYLAKNKKGVFLNGEDLQNSTSIDIVQFYLDKNHRLNFKTKPAPSCFISKKTGAYPNYLFYFKNLIYTKKIYE